MVSSLTRPERVLRDGLFGAAVIAGFQQSSRADTVAVTDARKVQAAARHASGYALSSRPILTTGAAQSKLGKNSLPSFGMMLIPERGLMSADFADIRKAHGLTGGYNLCPRASCGCTAACLSRSGQSGMRPAQRAQSARTAFLMAYPRESGLIIGAELRAAVRRHGRINLRLNTTSDIRWELFANDMLEVLAAAGVTLYDYTAWSPRNRRPSAIYTLTYSAKEPAHTSDQYLTAILAAGGTVAMPFDTPRGKPLPESWHGFAVIDGDKSDDRRLDPASVIVGLRAKGHEWRRPGGNDAGFIRSAAVAV